MIKINLLNDIGGTKGAEIGSSASLKDSVLGMFKRGGSDARPESSGEAQGVVVKVVVLLLPVVLTFGYRQYAEGLVKQELENLKVTQSDLQAKLKALEPAIREIEKFQEEKRKLDSQLDVIKRLSKERLKNVKSLDAMQGIIPQRAWLAVLKFTENKVELEGYASDDLVISEYMQALEASIYFKDVNLKSSEEFKKNELGVVKKFVINCQLENL